MLVSRMKTSIVVACEPRSLCCVWRKTRLEKEALALEAAQAAEQAATKHTLEEVTRLKAQDVGMSAVLLTRSLIFGRL
jgi:hypothetical protein